MVEPAAVHEQDGGRASRTVGLASRFRRCRPSAPERLGGPAAVCSHCPNLAISALAARELPGPWGRRESAA